MRYERKDAREKFCFTIDGKGTRAIDDAISIEKVDPSTLNADAGVTSSKKYWKIGIHIADLNTIVAENKAMDKEAAQRVNSKYIGKFFHKLMLPRLISDQLGSLKDKKHNKVFGQPERFAISLYLYVDQDGMIVYRQKTVEKEQIISSS